MKRKALTIAGSDSGGGAGIQADLKTLHSFGVYGMSVLTAITAQNTLGVHAALELPLDLIAAQLDSVLSDLGCDAAKTGMLSSPEIVELVAAKVRQWDITRLVVDPVMIAKGGAPILADSAVAPLLRHIVPLALVLTPNRHEAERLTGMEIRTLAQFRDAARRLHDMGPRWVVVKGGHLEDPEMAIDVVTNGHDLFELPARRVDTRHTHGTGCTFSAAITAGLALGLEVPDAIRQAKQFITEAIRHAPGLGNGHGPTDHLGGRLPPWGSPKETA